MSTDERLRMRLRRGDFIAERYEIREALGSGSAADVYRAWDRALDREVAVKVVRGGDDDRQAALMLREARILGSLPVHPALCRYFDVGIFRGHVYLVEELVEGASLDEWNLRRPGDIREILEMYAKIAEGLGALHAAGVVHRDVKPSNVLVENKTRQPKLTDMGLALRVSELDTITHFSLVGTPWYMAPEVLASQEPAGPAADIYALGVMLCSTIVGEFPGRQQSSPGIFTLLKGLTDDVVARVKERAPDEIAGLIRLMVAPDPGIRPEASRVAGVLRLVLEGKKVPPLTFGNRPAPIRPSAEGRGVLRSLRYLAVTAIGAAAITIGVLSNRSGAVHSIHPYAGYLEWVWRPTPEVRARLRVAGWIALAVLGGGVSASSVGVYRLWRRRTEAALAKALPVLARIQAIETQLKAHGSPTKSMVIAVDQMDVESFKQQLRESVVLALQDLRGHLGPTDGGAPSDLGLALEVIAGLTQRKKTPIRSTFAKKMALYVSLFAGGATAVTGITRALGAVDAWHPGRPPEITRVSPSGDRVRRGIPVRLSVEAKDPDGRELTFIFDVAGERLSPAGPAVLWRPKPGSLGAPVTFSVTVDDGRKKTVGYGMFVVDSPPEITRLDAPARVRAGDTAVFSAAATDSDGDEIKYAWTVSAGAPLESAVSVFTWRSPAHAGRVDVVLVASDGVDTEERRTAIIVTGR